MIFYNVMIHSGLSLSQFFDKMISIFPDSEFDYSGKDILTITNDDFTLRLLASEQGLIFSNEDYNADFDCDCDCYIENFWHHDNIYYSLMDLMKKNNI